MDKVIVFVRPAGLMRLDTASFIKQSGYKIAIAADEGYIDSDNVSDYIIYSEINNIDKLISDIAEFGTLHEIVGVLSFAEACIEQASAVAEALGLNGPSFGAIKVCRNKYLTRIMTKEKGVPSPNFFIAKSLDEIKCKIKGVKFPVIVKPLNLAGSCGVTRIDNISELNEKYDELILKRKNSSIKKVLDDTTEGYWIVEEYIEGFEISVESYTYNGYTEVITIHDKILPVEAPYFTEGMSATPSPRIKIDLEKKIKEITKNALKAVNFDNGVSHVEFRVTNDEPVLLEINGRPGGGLILESVYYSTGIKLNEALVKICLGIDPKESVKYRKPSVVSHISPPEGKILEIEGVNLLKNNKELSIFQQRVKAGDIIKTSSAQLGVVILATGNDIKYLIELIKNETSKINFIME